MNLLTNIFNEVCCNIYYFRSIGLFDIGDKFATEHIYDRSGQSFVPNIPVHVKSIVAERTYTAFTDIVNPYL